MDREMLLQLRLRMEHAKEYMQAAMDCHDDNGSELDQMLYIERAKRHAVLFIEAVERLSKER